MSELFDCRGLSCPEPVMQARQALQQAAESRVTVLVSNAVARDNVARTAKTLGWQVDIEEDGEDYRLSIWK